MDSNHVEYATSPSEFSSSAHVEYVENADDMSEATQTLESVPPGSGSANPSQSNSDRPMTLRRKSTLLLQGETDPECDEDMEFNKLNIATGEPVGKPLSRAGSGDEIQIGDEEASEIKYDTVITWHQGGNKVYVTGSFTGWRKMIKLNKQTDGTFSIVLKLPTGTHRMRFVVDNELRCSDFLPSATDSMGNLVNYIEVPFESQQLQQQLRLEAQQQNAKYHNDQAYDRSIADTATNDDSMEPLHRVSGNHQQPGDVPSTNPPPYQQPFSSASNQNLRLQRATTVEKVTNYDMSNDDELLNGGGYERFQEQLPAAPVYTFSSEIPAVFTDPEVMEVFVSSDFVTPPQLPPHLESVILNSNSNEKDNNSVLPIPNHVVLNHLATTSIKHNVLAVATVSRYSRKYVTQILYAPL